MSVDAAAEHRRARRCRRRTPTYDRTPAVARPTSSTRARPAPRPAAPSAGVGAVDPYRARRAGHRDRAAGRQPDARSRSAWSPARRRRRGCRPAGWPAAARAGRARRTGARRGGRSPGRPRSCTVVSAPGAHAPRSCAAPTGPGCPGASSAGGSRSHVEQDTSVRPTSRQPPGERGRIDAGVRAGEPDRAGRHPRRAAWPAGAPPAPPAARSGTRSRARSRRTRPAARCRRAGRPPSAPATPQCSATSARSAPSYSTGIVDERAPRRRRPAAAAPSRRPARPSPSGSASPSSSTVRAPGTISTAAELAGGAAPPQLGPPRLDRALVGALDQQGVRADPDDASPAIVDIMTLADDEPASHCRVTYGAVT